MHKTWAGRLAAREGTAEDVGMEAIKGFVVDFVEPAGGLLLQLFGAVLAVALVTSWCLFVLLLTGRLPWFVRKYF